jgi:hypothetical protein
MDTDLQVGPPTQDVAIEIAYAKYVAALSTRSPKSFRSEPTGSRDYFPLPTVPSSVHATKPSE